MSFIFFNDTYNLIAFTLGIRDQALTVKPSVRRGDIGGKVW